MLAKTLQLLFEADRMNVQESIREWLRELDMVILTRYTTSGLAYGMVNGLDSAWCRTLQAHLLPAYDILLDVPACVGVERKGRYGAEAPNDSDLQLLERTRLAFASLLPPERRVDGTQSPEAVTDTLLDLIDKAPEVDPNTRPIPGVQRLKVICACESGDRYLMTRRFDSWKNISFLIPVGGEIQFEEASDEAAIREFQEETGVTITTPSLLGVLENVFTWRGRPVHEVTFCYLSRVSDRSRFPDAGRESNGEPLPFHWLTLEELRSSSFAVYPSGVIDLLARAKEGRA
jgi:8-oxo-dGTP pyrophosphatase MutT (NUDIX family)